MFRGRGGCWRAKAAGGCDDCRRPKLAQGCDGCQRAKVLGAHGGCQRAKYAPRARWLLESKNVEYCLPTKVKVIESGALPLGKKSWLNNELVTKMVSDDTILKILLIIVYLVLV